MTCDYHISLTTTYLTDFNYLNPPGPQEIGQFAPWCICRSRRLRSCESAK